MSKICQQEHHLLLSTRSQSGELWHSPILSFFNNVSNSTITPKKLKCPTDDNYLEISSCHGILCLTNNAHFAVLWNPCIRRFNSLPPLNTRWENNTYSLEEVPSLYSFGYDHTNDVYKVVAISFLNHSEKVVNVYTLGTDYWRRIMDFAYYPMLTPGVFVSDAVNWFVYDVSSGSYSIIVSLDLKNESYQNLPQPNLEKGYLTLGVLWDCLSIFANNDVFLNIWVMKEFGNKESWTKLYGVPYVEIPGVVHYYTKVVYISEDDQVLFDGYEWRNLNLKLAVYNAKTGTFEIPEIPNLNRIEPRVYTESLISPCS